MTEADYESIWSTSIDTARFNLINVRVGELLNFWLTGDATTDVTDTTVLPILEQISEQCLAEIVAAAQITGVVIPYEWLTANVLDIAMRILDRNWRLLNKVKKELNQSKSIEIVTRTL